MIPDIEISRSDLLGIFKFFTSQVTVLVGDELFDKGEFIGVVVHERVRPSSRLFEFELEEGGSVVAGNLYFRRYDSREDFYLSHQRCIYENLDHIDLSPELKKVTLIVQF